MSRIARVTDAGNWQYSVAAVVLICLMAFVLLTACASQPRDCRAMQHRTGWTRITTAPSFAGDAFLTNLLLFGQAPSADDLIWYSNSAGQFMICIPGNHQGCGDQTVLIEADGQHPAERMEEITVCGQGSAT